MENYCKSHILITYIYIYCFYASKSEEWFIFFDSSILHMCIHWNKSEHMCAWFEWTIRSGLLVMVVCVEQSARIIDITAAENWFGGPFGDSTRRQSTPSCSITRRVFCQQIAGSGSVWSSVCMCVLEYANVIEWMFESLEGLVPVIGFGFGLMAQ